ncbi:MAG: DNA polymerase III subunit alpha, partial [Spirochaetaceae bacterium]|nr:DNA polymerase III subunit alpha [Spirochaetaceae bacterium]
GQVSLFEDAGEKEYADFVFQQAEEWSLQEKLAIEKELIGFYISGHPLDEYRSIIEKAETINIAEPSRAQKGKTYTIVGMIKSIRTITTKKGSLMAFCQFEDINGTIDLTFFQRSWEKYASVLKIDGVFGFKGKIDLSRESPSFLVDEVVDPKDLQERSIKEIHIKLENGIKTERDIMPLKNYLFEQEGNCAVYFHLEYGNKKYVVMANQQLTVPSNSEFLEGIKNISFVESVWKE